LPRPSRPLRFRLKPKSPGPAYSDRLGSRGITGAHGFSSLWRRLSGIGVIHRRLSCSQITVGSLLLANRSWTLDTSRCPLAESRRISYGRQPVGLGGGPDWTCAVS
jgi:hypothetical protein